MNDGTSSFLNGAGIDEPLERTASSTISTYLQDHLGSVTQVTNASGVSTGKYAYTPFGKLLSSSTPVAGNPYTYTAREDDGTGLYYYRARYYDPSLEAFISQDPYGDELRYVNGNPILFRDPLGLDGILINYPSFPITVMDVNGNKVKLPLGHSAVVAVDPNTGYTQYFEYGRYYGNNNGVVLNAKIPNLIMDKEGHPTQKSLDNLYKYLSKHHGANTPAMGVYYPDADYQRIVTFATKRMNDKNRKNYDLFFNNCGSFAQEAINAGLKK